MNLKYTIFILVIIAFLLQIFVVKQDAKLKESNIPLRQTVALSTFPLYDIAKNIAQDKLDIFMILPTGIDAHSYEPNPKQIIKLYKSDLVIYNGASLEPWISKLEFKNKTINMSKYVDLIDLSHEHHHSDEISIEGHHQDPHYWLSITNMQKATKKITQEFINIDAKNKDFYLKNQQMYLVMLSNLDIQYKKNLESCRVREIVTNHNAFSYLAQSYKFEVISLLELSSDAKSDAKKMISIINEIKEHKVSTIFYENFANTKTIEAIAKETKVSTDSLQPLVNITADEQEKNLSYEDIMRENLTKITKAMDCR